MIQKCRHCQRSREVLAEFEAKASNANEASNFDHIRGEVKVICHHCHDGWILTEQGEILAALLAAKLNIPKAE